MKRRSLYIVALAGPLSNIIIALLSTIAFHIVDNQTLTSTLFAYMATINILLALFNLLPIPPLDGSNIIYSFLSEFLLLYQLIGVRKISTFYFLKSLYYNYLYLKICY